MPPPSVGTGAPGRGPRARIGKPAGTIGTAHTAARPEKDEFVVVLTFDLIIVVPCFAMDSWVRVYDFPEMLLTKTPHGTVDVEEEELVVDDP